MNRIDAESDERNARETGCPSCGAETVHADGECRRCGYRMGEPIAWAGGWFDPRLAALNHAALISDPDMRNAVTAIVCALLRR